MILNWGIMFEWPLFRRFSIQWEMIISGEIVWRYLRVWLWPSLLKLIFNSLKSIVTRPNVCSHSTPRTTFQPLISAKKHVWFEEIVHHLKFHILTLTTTFRHTYIDHHVWKTMHHMDIMGLFYNSIMNKSCGCNYFLLR